MPMSNEELAARLEAFESKRPKILPPSEEELELKEEIAQILLKPAPSDADWERYRALHRLETFLYIERVNRSLGLKRDR